MKPENDLSRVSLGERLNATSDHLSAWMNGTREDRLRGAPGSDAKFKDVRFAAIGREWKFNSRLGFGRGKLRDIEPMRPG
jgi:hypothetical protein